MNLDLIQDLEGGEPGQNEPTFSFRETADILDIDRTTVSHAVSNGRISTVNTGGTWDRIPASEVIKYGMKVKGMDGEELRDKIHDKTGADDEEISKWFLLGLGLVFAYKVFFDD